MLHIVGNEVGYMKTYAHSIVVRLLESTSLFRNIAFYHTHNFARVYAYIVVAHTVVRRVDIHNLTILPALVWFPCVVKETRVRVVELVVLDNYLFSQAGYSRNDATSSSKISSTLCGTLVQIAHFDDCPVNFAIESASQSLCHMTEVHILVVNFSKIGMCAEVFVGRERSTELVHVLPPCHLPHSDTKTLR